MTKATVCAPSLTACSENTTGPPRLPSKQARPWTWASWIDSPCATAGRFGRFFKGDGDNYWLWGWGLRYSGLFPKDITYTIGKSDYHKDWFFQEVPHSTTTAWLNPAASDPYNQRFGWVNIPTGTKDPWSEWGKGRATTWTVKFNMPKPSKGAAILRIALAGADGGNGNEASVAGNLTIGLNGRSVGTLHPIATNALRYNTNKGVWNQYIQKFDAAAAEAG